MALSIPHHLPSRDNLHDKNHSLVYLQKMFQPKNNPFFSFISSSPAPPYFPEHSVIFWYLRDWFEKWFFPIAHLSLGYHKNQETAGSNSAWESSVKSLLIPQAEFITPSWGVPLCLMYIPLLYFSHRWQLLVDIYVSPTREGAGCVLLSSVCWAF